MFRRIGIVLANLAFGLASACNSLPPTQPSPPPPPADPLFSRVLQSCSLPWGKKSTEFVEESFSGSAYIDITRISAGASGETKSEVTEHIASWFEDKGFIDAIGATGETVETFVNLLHKCIFKGMGWDEPGPIVMFYRDRDGDGYGTDDDEAHLASAPPPGFVNYAGDCADNDSDVFPGQGRWFTRVSSQCDYDFDCDGVETMQFITGGSCRGSCGAANEGWLGRVPACGQDGRWLNDCDFKPFRGGCIQETQNRHQACR